MSQHDGTIGNDSGSNVRSDLQGALQASFSCHIGNSAPSTPYQGQLWIDNNTPSATIWTLSVYDGADWIALCYINTSTNVAYPVSGMPLLGFSAQGTPVMSGDFRSQATTATPGASNTTTGFNLAANGSLHLSHNGSYVFSCNRNSNGVSITFGLSGTQVGSISVSGSATTYATSSDYRLKRDVEPIDWREAADLIQRMNPVWFHWISDPMGDWVDGFIAHELAEVLPGAVTGTKDAMELVTHEVALDASGHVIRDADGQPKLIPLEQPYERIAPQGVDQGKLTPLLSAVIKGLVPYVLALEATVVALDGRLAAIEARGEP